MTHQNPQEEEDNLADAPPILGSWNRMYLFVLVLHFLFIAALYWFTHAYA